jgi:hypothetical protein
MYPLPRHESFAMTSSMRWATKRNVAATSDMSLNDTGWPVSGSAVDEVRTASTIAVTTRRRASEVGWPSARSTQAHEGRRRSSGLPSGRSRTADRRVPARLGHEPGAGPPLRAPGCEAALPRRGPSNRRRARVGEHGALPRRLRSIGGCSSRSGPIVTACETVHGVGLLEGASTRRRRDQGDRDAAGTSAAGKRVLARAVLDNGFGGVTLRPSRRSRCEPCLVWSVGA